MAIKHSEEADLWPLNFDVAFVFRLENIKDNAYSILVVVSNNTLVGVGCV